MTQSGGQTLTANAPSQAHLQGTQSQHTEANLAKEPALFPRFRDTPYFGGHRHSIQVTKTKGEHTTGGLAKYGQTEAVFHLSVHCASAYPA
jgi:hypothetical protein